MVTVTSRLMGVRVLVAGANWRSGLISLKAVQVRGPIEFESSMSRIVQLGVVTLWLHSALSGVSCLMSPAICKIGGGITLGLKPGIAIRKIANMPNNKSAKSQPLNRTVSRIRY